MEVENHTNSSGSTSPTLSKRVCKFFPGLRWFAGKIDGIRRDKDGNIYDILSEDNNTEEWLQDKYNNNAAYACIPIVNVGFRFIKKFAGWSFFSGRVFGSQSNYMCKCKFDENGDPHNYTLDQLQYYYIKHKAVYNDNYEEGSRDNGSNDNNEGNGDNNNEANEPVEKEQ